MLGCMVEESNLGITAAASLGAATRNITRADLDATFNMTERPFKGGIYVEDTKKLVLPDVPDSVFPEGVSVSKGRWEAVVEPEQAEKLRSRANASESTDKMAGIFFIFKILSGVL